MAVNNPKYILVHCSDTAYSVSKDQFNSIDKYHKSSHPDAPFPLSRLGFYGGYHSIITGGKNRRYREDDEQGAHCNQKVDGVSMNFQSLSVCIGFDGDKEYPTQEDAVMLRDQIWAWQDKYNIPTSKIMFHRDFTTWKTCPGKLITRAWLEQLIKRVPKEPVSELTVDKSMVMWLIKLLRSYGIIK